MRLQEADTRPRAYAPDDDRFYGGVIAPTAAGVEIDETNALEVPAVWKCVKILAESIASLPLHLYERDGDARSKAPKHSYYDLVHTRPNPEMSSIQYREAQVMHIALWGNHYSEKEMNGAGETKALWPLNPARVTPFRTDAGKLAYEFRPLTGETIILRREQVLHIPGLSFNGITGLSPIGYARESLGLSKALQQFGAGLFSKGALFSGIIEHPGQIKTDEAWNRFQKRWREAHSGLSSAHRVAILEEGMTYNKIGIPPNDAQFLETRKFQDKDIYGFYRIPPHLAADLDDATYSNITEQSLEFVIYTLTPWLVRFEQALNIQLLSERERKRYFFEHLVDGMLRGDPQKRWTAYKTGSEIGVLCPNDIRRLQNMNPIPKEKGGDDYHVPKNWGVSGEVEPPPALAQIEGPSPGNGENEENGVTASAHARIGTQFKRLIHDAAARIIRKEVAAVRRLATKHLSQPRIDDFEKDIETFYGSIPEYVRNLMLPVLQTFAAAIQAEITGQIKALPGTTSELEAFVSEYASALGERHAADSREQLRKIIAEAMPKAVAGAINQRMDEWEADRPAEIADREIVEFPKAVAAFLYAANGPIKRIL